VFTTGSKLFIGGTVLALTGTLVYGIGQNGSALGTIGMVTVTIIFAFLMGINFWVRDSNVSSMDTAGIETCSAASKPAGRSIWPLVGGFGLALLPVGLVVGKGLTWMSVIVMLIATVEWMAQSWSERASADPAYNEGVRKRIMHPLELPILGAIGLGAIIFSFSRIMLRIPKSAGPVVFGGIAAGVLLFGSLIATNRKVGRSLVAVLCSIGSVGIVGAGVASAIAGGKHVAKHELAAVTNDGDNCTDVQTEADSHSSRAIAATVILENGKLTALIAGENGVPTDTITIPKSLNAFIRFENHDSGKFRLRAYLGYTVLAADPTSHVNDIICTQAVGKGGTQFMIIKPIHASAAIANDKNHTPYTLTVPGVNDTAITIEVP